MSEESYDLAVSSKKLGYLYPILKDAHGAIIDGFHRENADPDWPSVTVGTVDNPVKLELARLAANFCRRDVPKTEIDNRVAFLIKAGLKPEQIAEQTGMNVVTVYRHMPPELKDQKRSEAIKHGIAESCTRNISSTISDSVEQPVFKFKKTSDEQLANIMVASCGHKAHITKVKTFDGKDLCPQCYSLKMNRAIRFNCPHCNHEVFCDGTGQHHFLLEEKA